MTRKELLTLKENLEQKKNVRKYVIIQDVQDQVFGDERPYKESRPMSLEQITVGENTTFVVFQIENYLQTLVKILVDIGVSFDEISFSSFSGVVCEERILDELYDEEGLHLVGLNSENVVPDIIPVRFKLRLDSLMMDFTVREKIQKKFPDIVGLINYNKFINSMDQLGYQIGTGEKGDFSIYLQSFITEDSKALDITVDLGKKEKTNYKENVKEAKNGC